MDIVPYDTINRFMCESDDHGTEKVVRIGDVRIENVRIEEAGRILIWQSGLAVFIYDDSEEQCDSCGDEAEVKEDPWEDWEDNMGIGVMTFVRHAVSLTDSDSEDFSEDECGYDADAENADMDFEPEHGSASSPRHSDNPLFHNPDLDASPLNNGRLHSLRNPDPSSCHDCRCHSLNTQNDPCTPPCQCHSFFLRDLYSDDDSSDDDSGQWSVEGIVGSVPPTVMSENDSLEERVVYLDDHVNHSDDFPRPADDKWRCKFSYCRHDHGSA